MRTAVLILLLFVTLPLSFQCVKAPLEPKAPQWSVPLNIQLIDRTFTMKQMIEKDPKFITDSSSGSIAYIPTSVVNQPTTITLPELAPLTASTSHLLGVVPISVPTMPNIVVSFKDIFGFDPPPIAFAGGPISFPKNDTIPNPNPAYDYLVFDDGKMSLTITNTFPFTISFSDSVRLFNANFGSGQVAAFGFPAIDSGQSVTRTASLTNKLMSAIVRMNFTILIPSFNKLITASEKITASFAIDGEVKPGTATLKSARVALDTDLVVQSVPDTAVQLIDDSTKIKRAEFKDGSFDINIINDMGTDIIVDFKANEFVDKADSSIHFKLSNGGVIPAKSVFNQPVDLTQYAIQSQKDTTIGGVLDRLAVPNVHFTINIKTLKAKSKVEISKDDSIRVEILPKTNSLGRQTYVLSTVIGKVKPTFVPINTSFDAATGDIGNKFTADSIKFDSVSITLKIFSSGSFPTDLKMKIIGLDNNGVPRDSLIARELKGGVLNDTLRLYPGLVKKIVFDKSTAAPGTHGIDEFLSSFFVGGSGSLPQKFTVVGEAVVDPKSYYQYPESTGTVTAGDSVTTSVDFRFPVRIGIMNGTYKDTINIADTSGTKINKDQLTSIDSGTVAFSIKNTFPFQLGVSTKLLGGLPSDKSKPDTSILLLIPKTGEILADSARYGARPNSPASGTYTPIGLTTADIDKINPASFVAIAIKIKTAGNGDHAVVFRDDYYVELKARVSVRFNVNFDKLGK